MSNRAELIKMSVAPLNKDALLEIITVMIDDPSTQAIVQRFLPLSTELLNEQPQDKIEVARLIEQIDNFVDNFEGSYYDDYDSYDDEAENYDALDTVNDQAAFLHPQDCMSVTRHLLIKTQQIFGDVMFGTGSLEQALRLYGQSLSHIKVGSSDKQNHFRWLISLIQTEAAGYGEFSETMGEALLHAATTPEDYTFLIRELQSNTDMIRWVMRLHLALGDDETYLRLSRENLSSEEDYLELADYWSRLNNAEEYISALEQWCINLEKQHAKDDYYHSISSSSDGVIKRLRLHYLRLNDDENLLRVLLFAAEYGHYDLDLYQEIKRVAKRQKRWPELESKAQKLAQKNSMLLGDIHLHEHRYKQAIELTHTKIPDKALILKIALAVKSEFPEEAIDMYKTIVLESIAHKKRWAYKEAAEYAGEIKLIYQVLVQDEEAWRTYINQLLAPYPNYPALQGEFASLS